MLIENIVNRIVKMGDKVGNIQYVENKNILY